MNKRVTEDSLGSDYVAVSYDGSVLLVMNEKSGFFNANELSIRAGKSVDDYHTTFNSDLASVLSVLSKYSQAPEHFVPKGWPLKGWYFHPAILLDFVIWISPEAFAVVAIIVGEVYRLRRWKLPTSLLTYDEQPYCMRDIYDPSRWCIKYSNVQFIVDKRGFFDATEFKEKTGFGKLFSLNSIPRPDYVENFSSYLYEKGQYTPSDQFYHPLLFLLLAQRVDFSHYVKCVRVIFISSGDDILDALFRQACQQLQPLISDIQTLKQKVDRIRSQMKLMEGELNSARNSLNNARDLIFGFDWCNFV